MAGRSVVDTGYDLIDPPRPMSEGEAVLAALDAVTALLAQLVEQVAALQTAVAAPRVRVPVRATDGTIIEVIDRVEYG